MNRTNLRHYLRHGTLTQLAAFEATARLGSCSKAAQALHLSQPAVSVLIRKLAEAIGLPLFERAGRNLALTAAGRELLTSAEELAQVLHDLEARLEPLREHAAHACTNARCRLHGAVAVAGVG